MNYNTYNLWSIFSVLNIPLLCQSWFFPAPIIMHKCRCSICAFLNFTFFQKCASTLKCLHFEYISRNDKVILWPRFLSFLWSPLNNLWKKLVNCLNYRELYAYVLYWKSKSLLQILRNLMKLEMSFIHFDLKLTNKFW